MLQSLSIKNYALIQDLDIDFSEGLTTITGETGAGKSILLGALSLILGQRADTSSIQDGAGKCIVEGNFNIRAYQLNQFFEENDLDYAEHTIIRREILQSGKSRAFINDTPVNVAVLKKLGESLVDVHSQHQNLLLGDNTFQLKVVDAFAGNEEILAQYIDKYKTYRAKTRKLEEMKAEFEKAHADLDYYKYQFEQLEAAKLDAEEQKELEEELKTLSHTEEIKQQLEHVHFLFNREEGSLLDELKSGRDALSSILEFYAPAQELYERLNSAYIELQDLANETDVLNESLEYDPGRIEFIRERLDTIYSLEQKHQVDTVEELIRIRDEIDQKIAAIDGSDFKVSALEKELAELKASLEEQASLLHEKRTKILPDFEHSITTLLESMGMKNAGFSVHVSPEDEFSNFGKDRVEFLFAANKNTNLQKLAKIASGGELSRVMLSLKSILAQSSNLPTIIFDEIDTGTSGEIAHKMGNIMKSMSDFMQVITITHLPQIASKGGQHLLVYKKEEGRKPHTRIRQLEGEERLVEIAKMLSGETLTDAALENAKTLLNN